MVRHLTTLGVGTFGPARGVAAHRPAPGRASSPVWPSSGPGSSPGRRHRSELITRADRGRVDVLPTNRGRTSIC